MTLAERVQQKVQQYFPDHTKLALFAREALDGVEPPEISTDYLTNFGKTPHIGAPGKRLAQSILYDYFMDPSQNRNVMLESVSSALSAAHDQELAMQTTALVDLAYECGIARLCSTLDTELAASKDKAEKSQTLLKYMKMGLEEVRAYAETKF